MREWLGRVCCRMWSHLVLLWMGFVRMADSRRRMHFSGRWTRSGLRRTMSPIVLLSIHWLKRRGARKHLLYWVRWFREVWSWIWPCILL
uniref:Secreted protein n=1 Tax=Arundo donax TaxID=35708 RepID=A0A0A9GYP0_ARUDO